MEDLLCIRAGDPIRIPATIKGRPVPKVTWDYDGKAKSHKKKKLHTLPVDSEVKTNTATQSFYHHIQYKPRLISKHFRSSYVLIAQDCFLLFLTVRTMEQYQLYRPIECVHIFKLFCSYSCIQVESTDTTSVVVIPVSLRSHSGRYTITAKNKSGQKHINCRVNVLGMSVLFV